MKKPANTRQLAVDILERSECSVQVGAAIADKWGIISWGWNSLGYDGFGLHAEAHAISRANKSRLYGATIYVASKRKRNQKVVISKPCPACQKLINKWELKVVWRDNANEWVYD
jgi:deoxycytidylate deaminase